MTETISRATSTDHAPNENGHNVPKDELEQDRSRFGDAIERGGARINASLTRRNQINRTKREQRARNVAHDEALIDYRTTDYGGYVSHAENLATQPDTPEDSESDLAHKASQRKLGENLLDQELQTRDADHTEALADYRERDYSDYVDHMDKLASQTDLPEGSEYDLDQQELQRQFGQDTLSRERKLADREERRDALQEFYSSIPGRLRGFGRAAVGALKTIGYGTRATAAVAGSAAARGAKNSVRRFNDYTYTPNVAMELQQHHKRQKKLRKERVAEVKAARKADVPTFGDRMAQYRDTATEKAAAAKERKAKRLQDRAFATYGVDESNGENLADQRRREKEKRELREARIARVRRPLGATAAAWREGRRAYRQYDNSRPKDTSDNYEI